MKPRRVIVQVEFTTDEKLKCLGSKWWWKTLLDQGRPHGTTLVPEQIQVNVIKKAR